MPWASPRHDPGPRAVAARLLHALRTAPLQMCSKPSSACRSFRSNAGALRAPPLPQAPDGRAAWRWRPAVGTSCRLSVISDLGSSSVAPPTLAPYRLPGSSTERQLPKRPVYSGSRLLRPFPASPTLAWARSGGVPPVLGSPKVTLSFRPVNTAHSSLFPLKRFGDAPPPPPPTSYRGTATEAPSLASDCVFGGWTSYGRLDRCDPQGVRVSICSDRGYV